MCNMKKWHKIGYFKSEDAAKRLVPHFFADAGYEAYFTITGGRDTLWVNEQYWKSKN